MLDIGSILFRWLFQCRFCDLLMGSGRDSTPFFVPHTVLIKKSHIADWIFTSHGDGSIKHKFKTHISSSTIFEEFCRRSATESHHGVVAVFHKASGGSVFMDRNELVAFLNRLRADRKTEAGCGDITGVLQKFVTPPADFDECHVVTFDLESGMRAQSHASKQQLWNTGIHVQRRCDLLGGYPEDVLKAATKQRDERMLLNASRIIHKFLVQHVINPEESDTRLVQVQRMVLVFKFDAKGRLYLIACKQLTVISALEHSPSAANAEAAPEIAEATTAPNMFDIDGGKDTVPVYNKMGQHLGVSAGARNPQQILDFSSKTGSSPEVARTALYAQERRLLGVVAEQSGYLAAELSTSNLSKKTSSLRRDPVEERRQQEEQQHLHFVREREERKNDWRNMFPKPGIVYTAAKADPDLRSAILGKLMAGDFPGMPSKQDLDQQKQQQQQQHLQQPEHMQRPLQHASPSTLHRKSPQKKPRITHQTPVKSNTMLSLDSPAEPSAPKVDADAPALPVVEEMTPGPSELAAVTDDVPTANVAPPKTLHAPKVKEGSGSTSRKPQPVRRPLNRAVQQPAAATHRSNVPDSARALRETAYFSTIPGEHLVAPKPPVSSGPANFPNSPFGKSLGATVDAGKKGTVRVVGKNGSIVNIPQRLMA
jgi:hypothetical protein